MSTELHVLAGSRLLGSFRLTRGMHLLGSSDFADLLLSSRDVAADVCGVELGGEGAVTVRPVDDASIRVFSGAVASEAKLASGDVAELGGLRLIILDHLPAPETQVVTRAPIEETAPSSAMVHSRIVPVQQPAMTFGRGPGNSIGFNVTAAARALTMSQSAFRRALERLGIMEERGSG